MGLARPAGFALGGDIACTQNFQKLFQSVNKTIMNCSIKVKVPFCFVGN